ncbi:MAG: hypothetical protein EBS18_00380 [Actinobacteria bacterium]|nr:hypothetical protein [Actinomycetota bacterium]
MAYYTGRTGALYLTSTGTGGVTPVSSEQALKIRDWSLETTLELLETTTIDTAVKGFTPGAVSSTGSATVLYYRREGTTSTEPGVQFDQFLGKLMKSTNAGVTEADRVGIVLRVGATSGVGDDIKDDIAFNAYITNASLTVNTGELASVAIQFTVDGPFRELIDA